MQRICSALIKNALEDLKSKDKEIQENAYNWIYNEDDNAFSFRMSVEIVAGRFGCNSEEKIIAIRKIASAYPPRPEADDVIRKTEARFKVTDITGRSRELRKQNARRSAMRNLYESGYSAKEIAEIFTQTTAGVFWNIKQYNQSVGG